MTPADLDAVEAAALRDAPHCAACGALATRACVGCHSTWCGSHDGTADAPPCRDGMASLREDVRLTLARALREAWAERSKTDARADRLAYAVNLRDAILARAGAKFGWPSGLSVTSGWRDMMERAVDETAAKLSRLENTIAQSRESYPRAEVLRMLNAAGVEGVGIVDRVRRLMSERDALRAIVEGRTVPPTDAEIEAHAASGGSWIVTPQGRGPVFVATSRTARSMPSTPATWRALDADGRPCAWPVVDGATGDGGVR